MQSSASPEKTLKRKQQQIRLSAMNLLARREHSEKELRDKLRLRYMNGLGDCKLDNELADLTGLIDLAVDELKSQDLQSDQRFAESFIRLRIGQGKGPLRILQDLKQKGIEENYCNTLLNRAEVDWFELALSVYVRKFGSGSTGVPITSFKQLERKDQIKRQRFLSYRGFSFEHINYVLSYEFDYELDYELNPTI